MKHALLDYEVYRPPQFAKLAGVTRATIIRWIETGRLKAHRIGSRYYIPESELTRIAVEAKQIISV